MRKSNKTFAVHAGEILKSEFMDPMGISAYTLAKDLHFPGCTKLYAGSGPSAPIPPFAWGNISACPRSFGSIFRMITISDLPKGTVLAEVSGHGVLP